MDGTPTIDPLAAAESRLLALAPDLLATLSSDGLVTMANPAWTAALGRPADELVGRPLLQLVHPEDRDRAGGLLGDERVDGLACRMLTADGTDFLVRWSSARHADGVDLAGRDVTEQDRLAAELQDFAYVASHDLGEPLRMVTAYLDLLQRRYGGQLDETADEFIGYAVDGAERMKEMIDALLAFSRVGTHDLQPVRFGLRDLLASQLRDGVALAEPAEVQVLGDPALLAQLLAQLVDNALLFRATDREPAVTVTAVAADDGLRIDVADNGIGIPAHQHDRIFKPFARLHGRDEYAGTGVGLALCRRIAERHGGRIGVTSQPGVGSVFSVWLPA